MQNNSDAQVLLFAVGQWRFLLDVRRLEAVLRPTPVAALPGLPQAFCGLLDWRGRSVPIIGLMAALTHSAPIATAAAGPGVSGRILLLRLQGQLLGLWVDSVEQVRKISASEILTGNADGGAPSTWCMGMCRIQDQVYAFLDVRPLLALHAGSPVEQNLLPTA